VEVGNKDNNNYMLSKTSDHGRCIVVDLTTTTTRKAQTIVATVQVGAFPTRGSHVEEDHVLRKMVK
jgi:hypothetical protein